MSAGTRHLAVTQFLEHILSISDYIGSQSTVAPAVSREASAVSAFLWERLRARDAALTKRRSRQPAGAAPRSSAASPRAVAPASAAASAAR